MFEWIKNNKQEIAILSLAVSTFVTGGAISPALEAIRDAFPESPELAIQMLVSLPPLALVVAGLLAGLFAGRVGKKQLAILGAAIYLVGGLGAGFCSNITTMLLYRLIVGIGAGMLLPLPISLIADFYTGEKRTRLTALVAGVASLGGVLMTIAAGLLTTIHWRLVFGIYLIMLPVLLMSLF